MRTTDSGMKIICRGVGAVYFLGAGWGVLCALNYSDRWGVFVEYYLPQAVVCALCLVIMWRLIQCRVDGVWGGIAALLAQVPAVSYKGVTYAFRLVGGPYVYFSARGNGFHFQLLNGFRLTTNDDIALPLLQVDLLALTCAVLLLSCILAIRRGNVKLDR